MQLLQKYKISSNKYAGRNKNLTYFFCWRKLNDIFCQILMKVILVPKEHFAHAFLLNGNNLQPRNIVAQANWLILPKTHFDSPNLICWAWKRTYTNILSNKLVFSECLVSLTEQDLNYLHIKILCMILSVIAHIYNM